VSQAVINRQQRLEREIRSWCRWDLEIATRHYQRGHWHFQSGRPSYALGSFRKAEKALVRANKTASAVAGFPVTLALGPAGGAEA
jgi:uncharacterized protein HemY